MTDQNVLPSADPGHPGSTAAATAVPPSTAAMGVSASQIAASALSLAVTVFFFWCSTLDEDLVFFRIFGLLLFLGTATLTSRIFTDRVCGACRARMARRATTCPSCRIPQ